MAIKVVLLPLFACLLGTIIQSVYSADPVDTAVTLAKSTRPIAIGFFEAGKAFQVLGKPLKEIGLMLVNPTGVLKTMAKALAGTLVDSKALTEFMFDIGNLLIKLGETISSAGVLLQYIGVRMYNPTSLLKKNKT